LLHRTPYSLFYFLLSVLLVLMHSTALRAQNEPPEKSLPRAIPPASPPASPVNNTEPYAKTSGKLNVLIDEGRVEHAVGDVNRQLTSSSFTIIEAERFQYSLVSLPDLIEQEVGVQVRASGGQGSLATVVLRGASSEQVVIYLDGVALNNASGGGVDLSLISLSNVERIEIYRGSTPLQLGEPSIGGAVNIITRKSSPTSAEDTQLSTSIASFDTYKLSASSNIQRQDNQFYLGASYLQSDNDFSYVNNNGTPNNLADDRTEKRQNDGVKHLSALANWKHQINESYSTEIKLDISDRHKELPSINNSPAIQTFIDTQDYNFLAQFTANSVSVRKIDAKLNDSRANDNSFNFNVKMFYRQRDELFDDSLAQAGFFNQRTESRTKKLGAQAYAEMLNAQQQWKLLSSLSQETYDTTSSLAAVHSDTNTRNKAEVSAESVSFFDEQHLIVNLVVRYQSLFDEVASTSDVFLNVTPGFEKRYTFVNPQMGIKYRVNKSNFLTANVGQYNRAPSFLELFGGGGQFLGNADLKPEQSINIDVGYTYTWFKPYSWVHNAEVYGGVFYHQLEDLIVRIYNAQGFGIPRNISDAVIQGLELTFKLTPTTRQAIHANLSFIDSVNKSSITAFKEKQLPGYYEKSFFVRYTYSLSKWLYSIEADIKRNVFYDRANLLTGDDVNLLNAGIRYLFNRASIDFRVNNLLDENIEYFRNRPTPGLNVSLTYSAKF